MKEIREIFETVSTYCGMIFLDAKMQRCEDAKSITKAAKQLGSQAAKSVMGNTESILAPMVGEESSSLRTVVSIRNAGAGERQNEIIQSNPSPEFLNSLPFIKKFYPAPRCGEGKVTEVAFDNNPNSSETDHASMPLGIFASKNLTAWLSSCLAAKHAAFTLAEVLITLGIIGVVAALTLPTLIQNHQKQVYVTQLKKAYSTLTNAYNELAAEQEVADWNQISCSDWYCLSDFLKHVKTIKSFEGCEEDWCNTYNSGIAGTTMVFGTSSGFITADGALFIFTCGSYLESNYTWIVDVNGYNKGPNKPGRDIFQFALENLHKVDDSWDSQNTGNRLIPVGAKTDYGYKTNDYIGEWGRWEDCSATNLTTSCTAKVLIEGKMNY